MFFGLMKIFRPEYVIMCLLLVVMVGILLMEREHTRLTPIFQSLSSFLSPIAINGLLTYLGEGGKDAVIRPWVWIFLLFFTPIVGSVSLQWLVHHAKMIMGWLCL